MSRVLFPDVWREMHRARDKGIAAAEVWAAVKTGVDASMLPSERAASLAVYFEYLQKIYGRRATRGLLAESPMGNKPS